MLKNPIRSAQQSRKQLKSVLAMAFAISVAAGSHVSWADTAADAVVKKSSSGICHDATSRHFNRIKEFEAYKSMQACIDNGGRKPKR